MDNKVKSRTLIQCAVLFFVAVLGASCEHLRAQLSDLDTQSSASTMCRFRNEEHAGAGSQLQREAGKPVHVPGKSGQQLNLIQHDGLYVRGKYLCSDGQPFIFKGVQIVGLVGPASLIPKPYQVAQQHYGQAELMAAKQFGANGIRFQVGQYGNDPQSSGYSADYVKMMIEAVTLALQNGFRVIVSVQAQAPDGGAAHNYGSTPLPDPDTLHVWQQLAPIWKDDPRVMYELFNEPGIDATEAHWQLAVNGGAFPKRAAPDNPQGVVIGFQQLIDVIRNAGAKNVIIVPGLNAEKDFENIVEPVDPLHNLAFGLHSPPLTGIKLDFTPFGDKAIAVNPSYWDQEFGFLTRTAPVITTEWVATSTFKYCVPNEGAAAGELLRYFAQHGIGVDPWAFDLVNTLIKDWDYTPTSYDRNVSCGTSGNGPGLLVHTYYTTGIITNGQ